MGTGESFTLGRVFAMGSFSEYPRKLRAVLRPRPKARKHAEKATAGSPYGGWVFLDDVDLYQGLVISAGLGEDASFDVEIASIYGCRVISVDPTPRAISHFREIQDRIGQPRTRPYSFRGNQDPGAYPLDRVGSEQLVLVDAALTGAEGQVSLFAPPNPEDVSYSISDFQNARKMDGEKIMVDGVSYESLIRDYCGGGELALVKLDIEGAEVQVIPQLTQNAVLPRQILVEFDELHRPDGRSLRAWRDCHHALIKSGFVLFHRNRLCFSYAREDFWHGL